MNFDLKVLIKSSLEINQIYKISTKHLFDFITERYDGLIVKVLDDYTLKVTQSNRWIPEGFVLDENLYKNFIFERN